MPSPASPIVFRRGVVIALLGAAHLLLAWLLLQIATVAAPVTEGGIAVVAVAAPAVPAAVPPPMTQVAVTVEVAAPEFAAPSAAGTGDCAVGTAIARALADDAAAQQALAAIPPAVRSVANTAMLWDGRWATAESAPSAVRTVVARVLRDTAPACRAIELVGPRLIFVDRSEVILAFGSGRWRWNDLVTEQSLRSRN